MPTAFSIAFNHHGSEELIISLIGKYQVTRGHLHVEKPTTKCTDMDLIQTNAQTHAQKANTSIQCVLGRFVSDSCQDEDRQTERQRDTNREKNEKRKREQRVEPVEKGETSEDGWWERGAEK